MHKKPGTEILYTKRPHAQEEPAHTRPRVYTKRGKKLKEKSLARKSPDTQAHRPNRAPSRRNLHKQSFDTEGAYTNRA